MESILYDSFEIEQAIERISSDLNNRYGKNEEESVVFLPILQGAVPFFADICRGIVFNPFIEYIGISSYEQQQQKQFNLYRFVDPNVVKDRVVWLFDDIADSGNTLNFLKSMLIQYGAKEVHTCVLLKKRTCPVDVDLVGFEMGDEWVWGYGMDAPNGRGRILNAIKYKNETE